MQIGIGYLTVLCSTENLPCVYQCAENAVGSVLQPAVTHYKLIPWLEILMAGAVGKVMKF